VSALAGPWTIVTGLLLLGGALKAAQPADTARALEALGLHASKALVRAGGVAEVGIAAGALATGAWPFAAFVAGSYLVFLAFVVAALRSKTPLSSCGCFGRADTPPTLAHAGVNAAAAGVALAAVVAPLPGLASIVADQPGWGIPFLFLAVVGVYLTFLMLSALPRMFAEPGAA
jgi:hypothetical protein